jgi:enoyl-CoA hydratase
MAYQALKVERRDKGVVLWTIDNPPANAINDALLEDLDHAAETFGADKETRVIVVTSAHPKTFLAGADLKMMMQSGGDVVGKPGAVAARSRRMQETFARIERIPKPVIAAMNGHALGGGCEFALACDFRFQSKGYIGLSEVSLGLIPGAGGTQRLTRLLGRAKATELIFLSKRLAPAEAEQIGLITRAVDEDELLPEALAFAEQLAEGAVQAMGLAKSCILAASEAHEDGFRLESEAFEKTLATGEPLEGLAAFFQKRKPQFFRISAGNRG